MLLGSKAFIAEARIWMRRFGGNVFTHVPYFISCWAGFRANKDAFEQRKVRLQEVVAAVQEAMNNEFEDCDDLIRFDPPLPQVSMVHVYFGVNKEQGMQLLSQAEAKCGVRCIGEVRPGRFGAADQSCSEFNMGPLNLDIPTETWVTGYITLLREMMTVMQETQTENK
jgi:hypothetical protein